MRLLIFAVVSCASLLAQTTVSTFTLRDYFGVTYPTQTVEFSHTGALCPKSNCRVIGPSSTEVAWQQLSSGNIIVKTGLSANATNTFTLQSGAGTAVPAPSNPVVITTTADYYQISNGLAGFRVRRESSNPSPYTKSPLVGMLLGDGTWVTWDNVLNGGFRETLVDAGLHLTGYRVSFSETGNIRTEIVIEYSTYRDRDDPFDSTHVLTIGPHSWTIRLSLDAGEKYWLYEDDLSDSLGWSIPLTSSFLPDKYRWRGHKSVAPECGKTQDGEYYSANADKMAYADVAVAGNFGCEYALVWSGYKYIVPNGNYSNWQVSNMDNNLGLESVYWNSMGSSSSPIVGFFVARLSKSDQGPTAGNMIYWSDGSEFELRMPALFVGPSNNRTTYYKRSFGIYTSTKANLGDDTTTNELSQCRMKAGGINLTKLAQWKLDGLSSPTATWPYTDDSMVTTVRSWVRDGTSKCGSSNCYYNLLYNSSAYEIRTISLMWRTATQAAVDTALNEAKSNISSAIDAYTNNPAGISTLMYFYTLLSTRAQKAAAVAYSILNDDIASSAQKESAKAIVAAYASIMNEDDFVPFRNGWAGDSAGTANMPVQYAEGRSNLFMLANGMSATFGASTAEEARGGTLYRASASHNSYGAGVDGTHYQSTFFTNSAHALLQLLKAGLYAPDEAQKRLGYWELSALTPPDPRVSGRRGVVSEGDGQVYEDSERLGLLATMFKASDPTAAGHFIWGWNSQGDSSYIAHDEFYTPTILSIDTTITPVDPALTTQHFIGHWTNFRHGWQTNNELALWFINGDFYSDHRHYDSGQVTIWAHNAPLADDWNPNLYNPHVPGRWFHNAVTLESELGGAWTSDAIGGTIVDGVWGMREVGAKWGTASANNAAGFGKTSYSVATFGTTTPWTRECRSLYFNSSYPLIFCKDSFTGTNAAANKILTWNFTSANNAVTTPNGSYTPTTRLNENNQVLPSTGCTTTNCPVSGQSVYDLSANIWGRFQFTGTTFVGHATGGINWDTWVRSDQASQWLIGHWSHNQNTYGQSQQILRLNSTGGFRTLIAPYRKGETPTRTLTYDTGVSTLTQGGETTTISDSAATWTDGTTSVLAVFDSSSQTFDGMTASGGPQEAVKTSSSIVWKIGGLVGAERALTLPSGWYPDKPIRVDGNTFYAYHDGTPNSEITITFSTTPATLTRKTIQLPGVSGAAGVKLRVDGEWLGYAACSSGCAASLSLAAGSHTLAWQYLDSNGAAVGDESATMDLEI